MMDGGQKDYRRRRPDNPRRFFGKTRAVKGLDENVKLNKALWHLAEALRTSEPDRPTTCATAPRFPPLSKG